MRMLPLVGWGGGTHFLRTCTCTLYNSLKATCTLHFSFSAEHEGLEDGLNDGRKAGLVEGKMLGIQHGSDIGSEVCNVNDILRL